MEAFDLIVLGGGPDGTSAAAAFIDSHTIIITAADDSKIPLHGDRITIATGSSSLRLLEFCFEDDRVHDSDAILLFSALPKFV